MSHVALTEPEGLSWRRCKQLSLAPASILAAFQAPPDMNPLEPVEQVVEPVKKTIRAPPKPRHEETLLRHAAPTPDYRPLSRTLSPALQTYMESAEAPSVLHTYQVGQTGIEQDNPYVTETTIYTPQNRRSFYRFIKDNYNAFKPPLQIKGPPDPNACQNLKQEEGKGVEAFLYQKFVREYIRNAGPYRGILVYHGLGSGKTCSSIAAAEALYGTSNKKIIVMTPSSLRPNFMMEVSFCGFRHFNVYNHWVAVPVDSEESMEYIYAKEVLTLSKGFLDGVLKRKLTGRNFIWVPDFEKTDKSDPTYYSKRPQQDQDDIRKQITDMIDSRITFISYNGISGTKLKNFAIPDPTTGERWFDNAVIVIDEVHNLTRLMQGNLAQYIVERKKKKTVASEESKEDLSEPIVPGRWEPKLLKRHEPYKRAYLLYKLLSDARNSKIIGLSGTPIINFPEELGIMANLLAGYMECAEFTIHTVKEEVILELKGLIEKEPRVDIVRFSKETRSTKVLISLFQEGYQRASEAPKNGVGVEYNENAQEDIMVVYPRIKATIEPVLQKMGIRMEEPASEMAQVGSSRPSRNGPYASYPRLPVDEETFRKEFINPVDLSIVRRTVLQKRLTGLISYYKGSKEDYMPRVTDHGIVSCDMSDYVLSKYTEARTKEIAIEKQQNMKASPSVFEAVDMFSKMKNPSNYRFHSRALSNFAFPKAITRPFPGTKEELEADVGADSEVISDEISDAISEEDKARMEREREVIAMEEQQAEEALEEKTEGGGESDSSDSESDSESMVGGMDPLSEATSDKPLKPKKKMGVLPSVPLAPEALPAALPLAPEALPLAPVSVKPKKKMGVLPSAPLAPLAPSAAADYQRRVQAALKALDDSKKEYLNLDDISPERCLRQYSTKMDRMLRNINLSKGSNLVYSQFKTVEGIGAFGIALKANGYLEIIIEGSDAAPRFSRETAESLRKGPAAKERRFISFTGEGSKERRSLILNVFNGNFDKLPKEMRDVLIESGYGEKQNQVGDICWVIGITSAGAEGISLKCCRSVHIMEPFWNNVRLDQVKGRAIRICSHKDIPNPKDRHVDIYTYVTTFSKEQLTKKEGGVDTTIRTRDIDTTDRDNPRVLTSDENVLRVSIKKDKINQEILNVMKESAVDCGLNVGDNQVECVTFNGKPDQYLFDPDLEVDKSVTSTDFKDASAPKSKSEPIEQKEDRIEDVTLIGYRGKRYLLHSKKSASKQGVIYLFAEADTTYETPLGEADIHPVEEGRYLNYRLYDS